MGSSDLSKEARETVKTTSHQGTRSTRACCRCRSRKVRCMFETPYSRCKNCHMHDVECVFGPEPNTLNRSRQPTSSSSPEMIDHNVIAKTPPLHHDTTSESMDSILITSQLTSLARKPAGDWVNGHMDRLYPFIEVSNIPNVPKEDLQLLSSRGCFDLPSRHIMDIMIEEYFLRIHPLLPIINEASFWKMYQMSSCSGHLVPNQKMSLLVLHAIMTVSCNFMPTSALSLLGFKTVRDAQATFYKRTKLLYDFNFEKHSIPMAQATLLLSQTQLTDQNGVRDKSGSMWLSLAIHHARKAGAHRYNSAQLSKDFENVQGKILQNTLKRLWWCCILSDRVLSLATRQSMQITRYNFDFDHNPSLHVSEMADEIHSSQVYDSITKSTLIDLFTKLLDFSIVLTDVLMMAYPAFEDNGQSTQRQMTTCRLYLRGWRTTMHRYQPQEICGNKNAKNLEPAKKSILLFAKLIDIYYYSALVVLCHHELYSNWKDPSSIFPGSVLDANSEKFYELRHALGQIAACLSEIVDLKVVKWLPISAIGCTAFPIALKLLEAKFLSPTSESESEYPNLQNLVEAMMVYCSQYECANWVAHAIRSTVQIFGSCLSTSNLPKSHKKTSLGIHWADILRQNPFFYMHLAMTLDLCISTGRLSSETDLPKNIKFKFKSQDLEQKGDIEKQDEDLRPIKRRNIELEEIMHSWDQDNLFITHSHEDDILASLSHSGDAVLGVDFDAILNAHLEDINMENYGGKPAFSAEESPCGSSSEESENNSNALQQVMDELDIGPQKKGEGFLELEIS